jgi:hypothetical protein
MRHFNKLFITAITAGSLLSACKPDKLDVDVSDIKVPEVKFMRFEKEFFSITPQNVSEKTTELGSKYGSFYHMFVNTIKGRGMPDDTNSLLAFVLNKDMHDAFMETQKKITNQDIEQLERDMTECTRRFHYFFPKRKLPKKFTTCMSGFDYNYAYPDSVMAVSLEMYLGSDDPFYKMLQWPNYQVRVLSKEYMLTDMVRGWLITEFDNGEPVNDLIHNMLFYGRILYACDALLPDVHDSIKIGYTKAQMNYCDTYEKNLWGFFAENNRLYENNMKTITEFTSDGPFTSAISKECPPRIAMWTGWQIVRSYMKNNGSVSVEELMNEKDVLKILNKSKYRP